MTEPAFVPPLVPPELERAVEELGGMQERVLAGIAASGAAEAVFRSVLGTNTGQDGEPDLIAAQGYAEDAYLTYLYGLMRKP